MKASTDGKGEAKEDLKVASAQLAAGTAQLKKALGSAEVQALLGQVDDMVKTGNELIKETKSLQTGIATQVQQIGKALESLQKELGTINTQLDNLQKDCEAKVKESFKDYNDAVDKAQTASDNSKNQIDISVAALEKQEKNATAAEKEELIKTIHALKEAKGATKDIDDLNKQDQDKVSITMPSVDVTNIQNIVVDIQTQSKTFQKQLPEMQKKLDAIAKGKDALPQDDVKDLTTKIDALNAGMEGLDKGIVALAGGINELDGKTSVSFPESTAGNCCFEQRIFTAQFL